MLTVLVQPVSKFMQIVYFVSVFIFKASCYIGQTIYLTLTQVCNIIRDVLITLSIIGEEFYNFIRELNASIAAVSTYISSSANGGINCVIEAVGFFIKHIGNFLINSRLYSKLLATHIGSYVEGFLILFRNALLLIADCAWWLITLLPRWLLYAIIAVGDCIVENITSVRKAIVYTAQIIVEDVFRLAIGIVILFLVFHNHRRLGLAVLRWILKVKEFIKSCCLFVMMLLRRIFRRRVDQTVMISSIRRTGIQTRCPLSSSINVENGNEKALALMQSCVICKERQKCVLLLPCKHLCLCKDCADYLFLSSYTHNCPLCRSFIEDSMSVYI